MTNTTLILLTKADTALRAAIYDARTDAEKDRLLHKAREYLSMAVSQPVRRVA